MKWKGSLESVAEMLCSCRENFFQDSMLDKINRATVIVQYMALSKRKTCLAVLRQITELNAEAFAALIGRSLDWLKKAESGKILVTPEIQRVIALETGVNLSWLHQSDPSKMCVDVHCDRYTKEFWQTHRANLKAGKPDMRCACNPCGWLLQIASIAESAGMNMKIDLFANDLDQALEKLAKKYGNALSACDRHVEKMAAHPETFLWLIADKGGMDRAESIVTSLPEIQNAPWTFTFLETRQRTGKMEAKEIFEKNPVIDPANRKNLKVRTRKWRDEEGTKHEEQKLVVAKTGKGTRSARSNRKSGNSMKYRGTKRK